MPPLICVTVMKYKIHEMFHTFQGEGKYTGRAAYFIRLFGCPLHCPWCDSAGTWHKDYAPAAVVSLTEVDILRILREENINTDTLIVITGGEPCIYDLKPLVLHLNMAGGYIVMLETSGAFDTDAPFNWFTLSPKKAKLPTLDNIKRADEIKLIIEEPEDIDYWYFKVVAHARLELLQRSGILLHPEWTHREDPVVLEAILNAVKRMPKLYRAGYQLHKLYKADQYSPGSKPLVPLGGNPELGY